MKFSLGICNLLEEISAAAAKSLQSCLTLCDPKDGWGGEAMETGCVDRSSGHLDLELPLLLLSLFSHV